MANIALTNGERYTFARQGNVTVITDSTDSAESAKIINNNLTLSGSATRRLLIETANTANDAYVHFASSTTDFSAGIRGAGDSFTISKNATLTSPGLSSTALRIPNITSPKVHFDWGIVSSGSVSINTGTNRALAVTGSAMANYTLTSAASLTFGATAGQIFRNSESEFAFGVHNAGLFPLYIQGRYNTNVASSVAINPLGGPVVIGSTTVDTTYQLDVNGKIRASGDLVVTGSAFTNLIYTSAASLTFGAFAGQIFRNENSEFAFGLHNAGSFPLYIQGRTNSNLSNNIAINPLGGSIVIGSLQINSAYKLDVSGGVRATGGLVVTGSINVASGSINVASGSNINASSTSFSTINDNFVFRNSIDADLTVDAAVTQSLAWVGNFTADRALFITNLTKGRKFEAYINNTNASSRTIIISGSGVTFNGFPIQLARDASTWTYGKTLGALYGAAYIHVQQFGNTNDTIYGSIT